MNDWSAIDPEPPLELNLTVYVILVQCAYSVWFDAVVTFVDDVTLLPPLAVVYQPLNVYPVRVGFGIVPYVESYFALMLDDEIDPPLAFSVTVYVLGVQCAYNVWLDAVVTFVDDVVSLPPLAAVYQPLNVYPVRVGVGIVPYVESYVTLMVVGETDPSLASSVTVISGTTVQCAYRV